MTENNPDIMRILLAVDGSSNSIAAADEAGRMTWPKDTVVKIISVAEIPTSATPGMMPMPGGNYETWENIYEDRALANVMEATARFNERNGAQCEVITKTIKGPAREMILDEADRWKADLVILGTHGYGALERLWLGSVSRAVVSQARCSVRIVRSRKEHIEKGPVKILIATDGSECSDAAVDAVANRPWPAGSQVHVIAVVHLPFTPTEETRALEESYYSLLEKEERERAAASLNRALSGLKQSDSARNAPLVLSSEVILGRADEKIIESAKERGADLIVLGSHGRSGFKRFLLGSVSEAVVSHAPCSVEIVRKPEDHA